MARKTADQNLTSAPPDSDTAEAMQRGILCELMLEEIIAPADAGGGPFECRYCRAPVQYVRDNAVEHTTLPTVRTIKHRSDCVITKARELLG